ncbi:hypothetical protein JKG68_31600 [Microvirga aerilata]|jgi:hypothetical protein|uniref:Uncharacterized protein n=1 Tax=Microvirga aerilata TaxID=670292 RepID=A0A936ZPA6_9HYPH|nr:hypothetical protein [Microvirga aerilata]MBL0408414.1 hypothetical protein [Microvirga aerilata]
MKHQIDMSLKKSFAADRCMALKGHAPDRCHESGGDEHEGEAGSRASVVTLTSLGHIETNSAA